MLKMFMVSLVLAGFSAFPAPWDARADIGPAAENVLVASVPQTESSDEEKATFDGEAAEIKENEEKPAPSKTEAGSASDERSNAALSAKLAEREADLARREAALAEREADLVKQDKASSASSVEVAEREAELAKREAALAEREAELANQGKSASASSAELAAREAELAKRESALTTREAELANQDKVSIASSAELAEREAAMKDKEAALTARESELERQSRASSESSAELAAREEDLKKREAALAEKREADLAEREVELKKKEAALTEKEAALQNKEIALMDKAPVVAEAPIAVPDVNGSGAVVVKKENGLMNWTENYIEATGMAVAPTGMKGAQGKALARRGATLDLQRNLLEFMKGVQIDAQTTMNDFMAENRVRSEISGIIKNVEVMRGEWDGEAYTVTGRIKLPPVRAVVAPKIPVDKTYKESKPKKSAGRYTGLVIDARHLPLVPSMSFCVLDESGKAVYGMSFADYDRYLQSGLCAYYNNINYAKGEVHVASNPIVTKALKLRNGNVDIVISNAVAAQVRGSSYDFRKDCKVIIVSQ